MSSLKATQADGYYIPPSSYLKSGGKATKSKNNQYLKRGVVRFELPYDGFCDACNCHVGKGTRFNAFKNHVDDYYTTKIWEFTMTCRMCAFKVNPFTIRTNPRDQSFDYVSGIRRKKEPKNSSTTMVSKQPTSCGESRAFDQINGSDLISKSLHNREKYNKLDGLEKHVLGQRKIMTERNALEVLIQQNKATKHLDADMNSNLRLMYRKERQAKKRRLKDASKLGLGYGIELLPKESPTNAYDSIPKLEQHQRRHSDCKKREKQAFSNLNSIFNSTGSRKVMSKSIKSENKNQKNLDDPNTVITQSNHSKKTKYISCSNNLISISSKNIEEKNHLKSQESFSSEKGTITQTSTLSSILVDYSSDDD